MLSSLTLAGMRCNDDDELQAFKGLVEPIEHLAPNFAAMDRHAEVKSRMLLHAVSAEAWYLHAESQLSYPYNCASVFNALHASIRAVRGMIPIAT